MVGGYFGLLNKILKNPAGGFWEVTRSSYGSGNVTEGTGWNLFGGSANSVSSPLTLSYQKDDPNTACDESVQLDVDQSGAKGFNFASGAPTGFQGNQRLKMEQAEAELMSMARIAGIDAVLAQGKQASVGNAQLRQELEKWETGQLKSLSEAYESAPHWYLWHALGAASTVDVSNRDGEKDLEYGTSDKRDEDQAFMLRYGDEIDAIYKEENTYSNSSSMIAKYLKAFKPNIANRSSILKELMPEDEQQAKRNSWFITADKVKLQYIAYRASLVSESSFETDAGKWISAKLSGDASIERLRELTPNFMSTFLNAWGLIHKLIAAYFGSGRLSSLPNTIAYCKQATWVLDDCALSAGAYMISRVDESDRDRAQNLFEWYNWFHGQLMLYPGFVALLVGTNKDLICAGETPSVETLTDLKVRGLGLSEWHGPGGVVAAAKLRFQAFLNEPVQPYNFPSRTVPSLVMATTVEEGSPNLFTDEMIKAGDGEGEFLRVDGTIRNDYANYKRAIKKLAHQSTVVSNYAVETHKIITALLFACGLKSDSSATLPKNYHPVEPVAHAGPDNLAPADHRPTPVIMPGRPRRPRRHRTDSCPPASRPIFTPSTKPD